MAFDPLLEQESRRGRQLAAMILSLEVAGQFGEGMDDDLIVADEGVMRDLWGGSDQTKVSAVMAGVIFARHLTERLSAATGDTEEMVVQETIRWFNEMVGDADFEPPA
ncbi:MAG: hypothetical protein JWM85_2348 [Acidimicrobiaceae bacterium]|nr:hypothetical protein [Acidimicrobiaceae bacterium]